MSQIFARNLLLANLARHAPPKSIRFFTKTGNKLKVPFLHKRDSEKLLTNAMLHHKKYLLGNSQNLGIVWTQTSEFHRTSFLLEKDDDSKGDQPPDQSKIQNNNTSNSPLVMAPMNALAPLQVPENFPNVPLVAVSRNPLFPRWVSTKIHSIYLIYYLFIIIHFTFF